MIISTNIIIYLVLLSLSLSLSIYLYLCLLPEKNSIKEVFWI